MRCLFCGATDLTQEDVIPKWLFRELRRMGVEEFTARSPRGTWTPNLINLRTRKFCGKECNNGWMSRLESATKPILIQTALRPTQTTLSAAHQTVLAQWVYKTVLTSHAWHGFDAHS